ncbi:MAG: excisionase family DNA-binding protein [Proteobacteria bacterium]|nr:excisionase family DNA-binding protein [Pseudomonadota bacterium]
MEKTFLTINEASEYLNLKPSTLYRMVETLTLPHYRVGRLIRFKKLDLDRWMEDHRQECIGEGEEVKRIFQITNRPIRDIDSLVEKIIADAKANRLSFRSREARSNQGPRKGG